jgi:hypothetical protein
MHLAPNIDSISIKRITISVQDSPSTGQSNASRVSISVVCGSWGVSTRSVGELVKTGSSTVLSMASATKSGESAVVQWAVDDLVSGGDSVGQDVALAVVVDVSAVVLGSAGGEGASLGSDGSETRGDNRAGRGRGGLEVLAEFGGRARGSRGLGSKGELAGVSESLGGLRSLSG